MSHPTVKELLERIERLEARIRQLEGLQTIHHYHHQVQPCYVGPFIVPYQPTFPTITCGGNT